MRPSTIVTSNDGKGWRLGAEQWLPRPIDEVFAFFSDAFNLESITPPWMRFRVITPRPIELRTGTLIDYRLKVRGIPMRWRSRITGWDPPHRFSDEMLRGPYRWWRHTHSFVSEGGGTLARDDIRYGVPGGRFVHALLVGPDIRRIFAFRQKRLGELFADEGAPD